MVRTPTSPVRSEQPIPWRLWKVAALSGMASYLDAALIVSIAVNLAIYRDSYDMGVWMAGAISAIVTGCIAVGSLVGGRLADMFGRRRVYNWDIFCFALGAIVITLAPNDIVLFCGVLVVGLAAGADLPTSLAVVSDSAPVESRARLVSFTQVMWVAGIVVVIFLGYLLSDSGMVGARLITGHLAVAALVTWQLRSRLRSAAEPSDTEMVREPAATPAPRGTELKNVWNRAALLPMAATFAYYVTWGVGANTFGQFGTYLLVTVSGASQSLATGINLVFLPIALVLTFVFVRIADTPGATGCSTCSPSCRSSPSASPPSRPVRSSACSSSSCSTRSPTPLPGRPVTRCGRSSRCPRAPAAPPRASPTPCRAESSRASRSSRPP